MEQAREHRVPAIPCTERRPGADAFQRPLRSRFRARLRPGVGLQTLQRTIHMNTTLSPVCVSPGNECSRPESVSPSPPHACPWDQGCYNAMDNTGTRRERP